MALDISQTLATTLFLQADETADVIMKNIALFDRLKTKGRVKQHSGGYELRKPVMYNQAGNGKWYSGLEALNTTITDDATAYVYDLKSRSEVIGIAGREKRANKGNKTQLIDLLDMKIEAGIARLKNAIAESAHGDGTGSSGKEFDGIQKHVSTTPSSGLIGGIDRAVYTWAQNQTVSGGFTSSTVQSKLASLLVKCVRGADSPDLGVADNASWTKLHDSFTAIQRLTDGSKGKAGFKTLSFMGVDIVLDGGYGDLAANNEIRLFTTDYITLDFHEDGYFKPINPEKRAPVNQDAEYTILLAEGNLCFSAHPFHGVLS